MSSSFTSYKGAGFWAKDPIIEIWLLLLAKQMELNPASTPWAQKTRQYFILRATGGFLGCIDPELGQVAKSKKQYNKLLSISISTLSVLTTSGDLLNQDFLNDLYNIEGSRGQPNIWNKSVATKSFIHYSKKWISLLRGDFVFNELGAWDDFIVDIEK